MSEHKERSAIFKFFYVILSIITFPIFFVLFIFRHPLWILFILLCVVGGVAYYPMSQGVKIDQIAEWYKAKYKDVKVEMVAKAKEHGMMEFVPQNIQADVKNIEDETLDASVDKGENYNKSIARDENSEQEKAQLKKRSGFKSRQVSDENTKDDEKTSNDEVQILNQENGVSGGLSAVMGQLGASQIKADETENTEPTEDDSSNSQANDEPETSVSSDETNVSLSEETNTKPQENPEPEQNDEEFDLF